MKHIVWHKVRSPGYMQQPAAWASHAVQYAASMAQNAIDEKDPSLLAKVNDGDAAGPAGDETLEQAPRMAHSLRIAAQWAARYILDVAQFSCGAPASLSPDDTSLESLIFDALVAFRAPSVDEENWGAILQVDWFVVAVALTLSRTDPVLAQLGQILGSLSVLPASELFWPQRSAKSPNMLPSVRLGFLYDAVAFLVQQELVGVYSAFKMRGVSVAHVASHWTQQCFVDVLDVGNVEAYIGLCVTCGAQTQAFFIAAVFRHLEVPVREAALDDNLHALLGQGLVNFCLADHTDFIESLEAKYGDILASELAR